MIFFFVLFIGVSWGLGYIHFEKKNTSKYITTKSSDADNTTNEETSSENQSNNNKPTNNFKKAYVKYDFDWVSKTKYPSTYVQSSTVRAVIDEKIYDVAFNYGEAKYSFPLPGHDFHGITVINDSGEAYIGNFENGNFDSMSYTKVNISEKIVDICFTGDPKSVAPYSGPYYMTESGKVLDRNGKTYEEINKNHISYVGTTISIVYICDDNTIDIPLDYVTLTSYTKVVDSNKNNLKAKQIFHDSANDIFYIITETNKLFKIDDMKAGVATPVNTKDVKALFYTASEYHMVVRFTDDTKTIYSEIYSA